VRVGVTRSLPSFLYLCRWSYLWGFARWFRENVSILLNDLSRDPGLTGAFLLATTTARTSNALLGWNCGYVFFSNIMYGVLYAISPEIFPAKDRGTGNGLTSTATRVFGVIAPIIALYANLTTSVPVYIAGGLIVFAGLLALLIPYEPRGHVSI